MRRLSHKQRMWEEIAAAFETEPTERSAKQQSLAAHGLCLAVYSYQKSARRKYGLHRLIAAAFNDAGWLTWGIGGIYLSPPPRWGSTDIARAGLAALFAAMTDVERERTFGYAI